MTTQFYNNNATALAQQYLSKSFDEVHASWSKFLPAILEKPNARILDIGAGAGRDVKHHHPKRTSTEVIKKYLSHKKYIDLLGINRGLSPNSLKMNDWRAI